MIIKEINIQNFKSFGNNKQTIKFDNKGSLILLKGNNGAGKSTFQESIDFSLFGIVRGKEKKRIPQIELPNRFNSSLLTSIKFINNNNDEIFIERGLKPTKLKVELNSIDITSKFKLFKSDNKDDIIGFNYDIYKSFISMSLNDFTNFINLDPDTKRKLLNKLFKLDEIDEYYKITKDLIRNNNTISSKINADINNNNTILTYKKNIENIKKVINNDNDKDHIKNQILEKKSLYLQLKNDINDISIIIKKLNNDIKNRQLILDGKNNEINKINIEIKHNNKKIDIFKSGRCPICNTQLNIDHNKSFDDIINNNKKLKENKINLHNNINQFKIENKKNYDKKNNLIKERNFLYKDFNKLKNKLIELKKDYLNYEKNNKIISEINNNIIKLNNKNEELNKLLLDIKNKNNKYEQIIKLFSSDGIRKFIISDLIKPLNVHLIKYLNELNSIFKVEIDNNFNASVYDNFNKKIHPETLSSGESKKINIALALSYIEIIRKKNKSNILFLDELFANIDSENISLLLKILKTFSINNNINIIIIVQDYYPINETLFDRIITIEKNMFSILYDEYK
jgi:DNA repair exonuclease SbcCD ATPase subunit